ncbi:MAG TPA: endo-1,4-beta-xylanase, partial [Puia sp.]
RNSIFLKNLGPDYIVEAFRLAQKAAPHTELYYNDYNIESPAKRAGAIGIIKKIKAAGVRIDGVGIQGHWHLGRVPFREIEESIEAFSKLGVKVNFTELDISVLPNPLRGNIADVNAGAGATEANRGNPWPNGMPDSVQDRLAEDYAVLFRLFMQHKQQIGRVTFWGVEDGVSWLNDFPVRGRTNYPLLFDRNYAPKKAFYSVIGTAESGQPAKPAITVRLDQQGHAVPSTLYGLMTEEINYSYEGGLYGELVRNRAFRNNPQKPDNWSLVQDGDAKGSIGLDRRHPLNEALNVSLRLEAQTAGTRIGIANEGYWGFPVRPSTSYAVSFFVKGTRPVSFTASIESKDGKTVYAQAQSAATGNDWRQQKLTLTTATGVTPTADTRFVIATKDTGTFWFDQVSVFPPTYHNTPNGNRPDIMQLLSDMKPAFLRFPGGNYLEGDYFMSRFDWKKTIGPQELRPGHPSPWGYRSSDGFGLHEFLMWCEDLHMEPLLAVFAGYTLKGDYFDDPAFLKPFIDEALEEIEYITGDASTTWGAVRARNGHPAPFPLHYVEVGNEDFFDRSGSYGKRLSQFSAAIRAKYPQLKIISTVGARRDWATGKMVQPEGSPDLIDDHFYRNSMEMQEMATLYDSADRRGPKIFVGEWATREGSPTTNLYAALGDAAFLTGLERNSDLVLMSCYAPLFVNVNPGGMQWKSDLIGYNTLSSYGSPSYYVQKMFSESLGSQVVNIEASGLPTQTRYPNAQDSARGVRPKTIPAMFFSATKDSAGRVFLKVVNATASAQDLTIELAGVGKVASQGMETTIGSDKAEATNTIDDPVRVVPVKTAVKGIGKRFVRRFQPYSVTVLEMNRILPL